MNLLKIDFIKLLGVVFVFIFSSARAETHDNIIEPFTVVAIPDTQIHSFSPVWFRGFADYTSWIRTNAAQKNIVFVTHLGDVMQGQLGGLESLPTLGWQDQIARAHAAISQLDATNLVDGITLPYSISMGNHDLLPRGNKLNPADPVAGGGFRSVFGAARYEPFQIGGNNPFQWYGGSDITQWNHYQVFKAGPYTYLHINLELDPQHPENDLGIPRQIGINDALTWAQSVIDAHPGLPTIISTHKLLSDFSGQNNLSGYWGDGVDKTFGGERTSTGQIVWEQLVKVNPQVFMTINGHEHEGPYREDGEYHQVSTNDAGLSVFEILVNHQDYFNLLTGNDPYLRLMEFDPRRGQIRNQTFSPTLASFAANPDAIETAYIEILDAFEFGMFIPILNGEDLVSAIAPFPLFPGDVAHSREEAASVMLSFFSASSIEQLRAVEFSPYLTDADSQFSFDVGFDDTGRPTRAEMVKMKIQPFHCSGKLKLKSRKPFLAVALLGNAEFSANMLDHSTLKLEGVAAFNFHKLRDVGTAVEPRFNTRQPLGCNKTKKDGFDDLLVFFNRTKLLEMIKGAQSGESLELRLTGKLKTEYGGQPVVAKEVVIIK